MYGVSGLVSFDLKQGIGQVIYLHGHAWRHTDKTWISPDQYLAWGQRQLIAMSSLHYNWADLVKKKGGPGRNEIGEASHFLCVKSTKLSMRIFKSWLTCYGALCAEEYISVGWLTA